MARKKKSMIGIDPLAWLGDEKNAEPASVVESKKESSATEKMSSEKIVAVSGHHIDETALLKGYKLVVDNIDSVAEYFYEELFRLHPDIKPLFKNTTLTLQANKLAMALKVLVDNLHDEKTLKTILSSMGIKHRGYGVLPEHYPVVVNVLIKGFKNKAGRSWTKVVSAAWTELLEAVAEIMNSACNELNADTEVVDEYISEAGSMVAKESVTEEKLSVLELNAIQDISKSQALKNDILSLVNDNDEIDIDASEVERVDGSALQLLCALFIYAQSNNLIIHWVNPSDLFIQSVRISGMQKVLELS